MIQILDNNQVFENATHTKFPRMLHTLFHLMCMVIMENLRHQKTRSNFENL